MYNSKGLNKSNINKDIMFSMPSRILSNPNKTFLLECHLLLDGQLYGKFAILAFICLSNRNNHPSPIVTWQVLALKH